MNLVQKEYLWSNNSIPAINIPKNQEEV